MKDNIGELLDIEVEKEPPRVPVVRVRDDEVNDVVLDERYAEGEERLTTVLVEAVEAFRNMHEIAKEDERARSFEVVGHLAQTISKLQGDVLELTERRRGLRRETEDGDEAKIVQNNLIINGTTAEILESLDLVRDRASQNK